MTSPESFVIKNLEHYEKYGEDWVCPGMVSYLTALKESGFKPNVIYDIGSCVGHWSRIASRIFPEASIFCFEPNPDASILYIRVDKEFDSCLAFKDMPQTRVYPVLLSDVDGQELKFHYSKEHINGNSYYKENSEHFDNHIIMTSRSLDSFDLPPPDLVKIDVQGAEMDVIRGGIKKICETQHLVVEMQHTEYNLGAPQVGETKPFIESLGFKFRENIHKSLYDGDYTFEKVQTVVENNQ